MSETQQTPTAEVAPVISIGRPSVSPGIPMDKLTNRITIYSGVMPLTMTFEALVQELENEMQSTQWYITLHLTGFGSAQRVFISETVPIVLDTITAVPFLPVTYPPVASGQYGLNTISTGVGGSMTVEVKLSSPIIPGGPPSLQILNTDIDADWVIGAIDILITDPPVVVQIQS